MGWCVMNEYFIAGEITNTDIHFSMVIERDSAMSAFDDALKEMMEKIGVEKSRVRILLLNKC